MVVIINADVWDEDEISDRKSCGKGSRYSDKLILGQEEGTTVPSAS